MLYKAATQLSEAYINWGDEWALVDKETMDNCFRFLYSIPQTLPIPVIKLNEDRTVLITWITEYTKAHLEIGPSAFRFSINDSLTLCGDASNIPTNLLTIMENE